MHAYHESAGGPNQTRDIALALVQAATDLALTLEKFSQYVRGRHTSS